MKAGTLIARILPILFVVFCEVARAEMPDLSLVPDTFNFVINADPQMGPADSPAANERHLYQLVEQFVREVNARTSAPAFVVFNGDLVAFARQPYFDAFVDVASLLVPPTFLVHGNHDGRHPDTFFVDTQAKVSGFQALQYSFDAGQWHFVVLPGKEHLPTPESEQAMLDWLDADLAANTSRPTLVFLHYHLLPVGLSQAEYYTLPMALRRALIERFIQHKQVRYVISGHVHCGIQSSIKSSWTYGGTHFVVAPSPLHPRNFGEEFETFLKEGEPNEGYYLDAEVSGPNLELVGRRIGSKARHPYPASFTPFDPERDPRALRPVGEVPPTARLENGDFSAGLSEWLAPHRYRADVDSGFVEQTTEAPRGARGNALWLLAREKGHAWAYDEFNERYQVVSMPEDGTPVLRARYHVPMEGKSAFGGGYVRVTAYAAGKHQAAFFFHWGANEHRVRHFPQAISYADHGTQRGLGHFHRMATKGEILSWRVPDYHHRWHTLEAPLASLYDEAHASPGAFEALEIDRLLIAVGVWTGMEPGNRGGAWFDDIALTGNNDIAEATVDGRPLNATPDAFSAPYGSWYLRGFDK